MSIEKLNLASPDLTADILAQLKALAPQAFNLDGALNPDKLKEAIGADVVVERERFGLNWPGKQDALRAAARPTSATLRPEAGKSVNFDTTGNVIIEGDNLETLKVLQRAYHGKIKMVYIDPPYNTGKDFVYPDDYAEPLKAYLERTGQKDEAGFWTTSNGEASGRKHSNWLSMMTPRLMLARNLLREDGVIFVSIDDNEVHRLRMLMDEVFGEENFVGEIVNIHNPKGRSDDRFIATSHEYLVVFSKNREATTWGGFTPEENVTRRYNKTDDAGEKYREIDLRKTGDHDRRTDRPNLFYYFYFSPTLKSLRLSKEQVAPVGDEVEIVPLRDDGVDGCWRWGIETATVKMASLIARFMPNRKIWGVFEKDYLEGRSLMKPTSSWAFKDVNSERGSEQIIEIGFDKEVFPHPKPIGTIQRTLELSTASNTNDLILDFFAGSGTTAHAVMNLNAQDNGNRKFILVQIPEPVPADFPAAKAGFKTIADITRERVRRAGRTLTEGAGLMAQNLDTGFRSFRLDSSNFREWNKTATPGDLLSQIAAHADSALPGRSEQDLLYEVLVKAGFSPAALVESFFVNSQACHGIHDRQWVLCLEAQVKLETLEAIAALDPAPARVICLDGAFANDAAKANAAVFYRQKNIELRTV